MDDKYSTAKESSQYKSMSSDDQKNFQGMYMMQMGQNMSTMMNERETDD